MSTLFISDLHLQDSEPEPVEMLIGFLAGPARAADTVYILGDLFEFWIGDDALSATAREVAKATSELAGYGVPCYFIHGNRDFMLGQTYASGACLRLLPETHVADLYGFPTLLLHGDTLCTDDVEYQAFRMQTRNPAWQEAALAMSVEERLQMARNARDASVKHTQSTAMEIMDVNPAAVVDAFGANGVTRMIHGHTHRPAVHQHELPGGIEAERIVLADWYHSGSYLEVSPTGTQSIAL